eukprot:COSAG04_NODE_3_length_53939_cov_50.145431_22_plen_203_part_00
MRMSIVSPCTSSSSSSAASVEKRASLPFSPSSAASSPRDPCPPRPFGRQHLNRPWMNFLASPSRKSPTSRPPYGMATASTIQNPRQLTQSRRQGAEVTSLQHSLTHCLEHASAASSQSNPQPAGEATQASHLAVSLPTMWQHSLQTVQPPGAYGSQTCCWAAAPAARASDSAASAREATIRAHGAAEPTIRALGARGKCQPI